MKERLTPAFGRLRCDGVAMVLSRRPGLTKETCSPPPISSPSAAAPRSSPAGRPASAASAAEALLAAGARVLIASRKAEACEAAAKELSAIGPCEGFGGTVANEAGVAALAAETRRRTDVLHILVNNAGVNWGEPFETFPWKAWERVMSVNVAGLFSLTRDLAPMLVASASRGPALDRRQPRLGDGQRRPSPSTPMPMRRRKPPCTI